MHAGKVGDITIYGQKSNYTTWRLVKMNLAIRGIDAQIANSDSSGSRESGDLTLTVDSRRGRGTHPGRKATGAGA